MNELLNLQLTIDIDDQNCDEEEKNQILRNLQWELSEFAEVEAIDSTFDAPPSMQHRAIGGFLTGILMAEVNPANLRKLFAFLSDRLGNKSIKLKLKTPDGRELEVEASSKEEFEYAIAQAERFTNQQ